MDELKACPFCGSSNIQPAPLSDYEWYRCNDCDALSGRGGAIGWNSRPLEDALQAEIARLREAQRWIPVSERLPEDMTEVLVLHGLCVTTAKYYHYCGLLSKHGWYQIDGMKLGVSWATHWMPLPEPPQEA